MKTFTDRLIDEIRRKKSILVVGLDPQIKYFPQAMQKKIKEDISNLSLHLQFFGECIIDAVAPFAVAVKPQIAFYERYGSNGVQAFENTVWHAKKRGLLVIEDAKRGDGGDTAEAYAEGHLGSNAFGEKYVDIDCMTINASIGDSCVLPFVKVAKANDKGIFIITKTSFKPNSVIENTETGDGTKMWQVMALEVNKWGDDTEGEYGYKNVGAVIGATYPQDAEKARMLLPSSFFLVPGYGAQGGGADDAVKGVNKDGLGVVVNSSRGIIYAYRKGQFQCDDMIFEKAATKAAEFSRNELNNALERAGKIPW